jgi:coenzyme F420-reducing hydrogenase gamma subunit
MPAKAKLAIEDCAICGGCEIALADLGIPLLKVLDKTLDLVYAPILASATDYDEADVTLVIGTVRTKHDLERVQEARKKSKILVSFGTCPSTGGLVGLGNLKTKEELLAGAYGDKAPTQGTPELLDKLEPLSKHVKVDYVIPGCPPPGAVIRQLLNDIFGG